MIAAAAVAKASNGWWARFATTAIGTKTSSQLMFSARFM
jgi:hypothetical protein